jgi:hypothetical protein
MSIRETQAGGFTMDGQAELWNWVHNANIERYQRLLTTSLTPVERRFIERRIGEEEAALRDAGPLVKFPRVADARRSPTVPES